MGRRYRALHFNLQEGENVRFHREHRSKKGRKIKFPISIETIKYRMKKKYGNDAKYFKIRD